MASYFKLEWKRLLRWFQERQVHPLVGIGLGLIFLYSILVLIYFKITYAGWVIVISAAYITMAARSVDHRQYIKDIYGEATSRTIRVFESIAIGFLFIPMLLLKGDYLPSLALTLSCVLVSQISISPPNIKPIATPFSKKPFEYIVGLRKHWWLLAIVYILSTISISVGNFNLGLFSLLMLALTPMMFHQEVEREQYISVHVRDSASFLKYKLTVNFWHYMILISVPLGALLIRFSSSALIILCVAIMGILWSSLMLCMKYKSMPNGLNILDRILLTIYVVIPLLLLFAIPYYYQKAHNQLKTVLG